MINRVIKKAINYILSGSSTILFACAYGVPMELENTKTVNVKDINNKAIPGLKTQLFENRNPIYEQFTNADGNVNFSFMQRNGYHYSVLIQDEDGEENGGDFETQEIDINNQNTINVVLRNE